MRKGTTAEPTRRMALVNDTMSFPLIAAIVRIVALSTNNPKLLNMQRKPGRIRQIPGQNPPMSNEKRCHLEQGLLDLATSHGVKFVRIIEAGDNAFVLEVTFKKLQAPYYLATVREPYNPREFLQIHTAIQKAKELFALREVTIVFKN